MERITEREVKNEPERKNRKAILIEKKKGTDLGQKKELSTERIIGNVTGKETGSAWQYQGRGRNC